MPTWEYDYGPNESPRIRAWNAGVAGSRPTELIREIGLARKTAGAALGLKE